MESATSTTAIVFAHTIVEAPKNGAISRAAAISAPSVEDPTTKTSSSSGGRAGAAGAAGAVDGGVSSRVATRRVWRGRLPTAPGTSVRAHGHRCAHRPGPRAPLAPVHAAAGLGAGAAAADRPGRRLH